METVTGYSFRPDDLRVADRLPGLSGFVRTRNGADFLEATIRSHIDAFDEMVAVYNQCTDATPDILARLAREYGPKLKVYHYADRVHPPGSADHVAEPANSPHSVVNYSNFALSRTTRTVVTKVDDDHLAIPGTLHRFCGRLRAGKEDMGLLHCISGVNLVRDGRGRLAVPAVATVSGSGDIGFFEVRPDTFFVHDRRFERFGRGGLKRRMAGLFYWHLKFLKAGEGFANYELERNPESRFERLRGQMRRTEMLDLAQLRRRLAPTLADRLLAAVSEKHRLILDRNRATVAAFPQESLEAALDATSPGWQEWLGGEAGR